MDRSAATRPSRQVTCDKGDTSLKNSYWRYQILNIFYDNSLFIVTNLDLTSDVSTCDLALSSNGSFAWLAGLREYRVEDTRTPLPVDCTVSMLPVLGSKGATGADNWRRGFLLEHNYTTEDCAPCTGTGGRRCRFDVTVPTIRSSATAPTACTRAPAVRPMPHRLTSYSREGKPFFFVKYSILLIKLNCTFLCI